MDALAARDASRGALAGKQVQEVAGKVGGGNVAAWLSAVRLRHWSKNLLVFLPILLSHQVLMSPQLEQSLWAFLAFSLCASSAYIINDLSDRHTDLQHPARRSRPFASGRLGPGSGALASFLLLAAALGVALQLGHRFELVLVGYYFVTWAYSRWLRSVAIIDVLILAGLYSARIVAGSAATDIALSYWFLALATFMFLSLAVVKRYAEIREAIHAGVIGGYGRGYDAADLPFLSTLGIAAGYCSVLVLALYINSADATALYRNRGLLWLICPLLWFWIVRVWRMAMRGEMPEDPVVFATADTTSYVVLAVITAIAMLSI
ncbi:MAG TPA: UbiA family prenyltransferase [Steroidobacteraceae bacterium]|nr:UbiA family prenyltransferase [Steroidobacteraceae bacterium]